MKYEIRKNGEIKCQFDVSAMYTEAQVRSMEAAGYLLYADGKRCKNPHRQDGRKTNT